MSAVQIEYSLWTRHVEADVLGVCRELGIGFVGYSPLGRGFLAGAITAEPPAGDMRRGMPRFSGDNLRQNLALTGLDAKQRDRMQRTVSKPVPAGPAADFRAEEHQLIQQMICTFDAAEDDGCS